VIRGLPTTFKPLHQRFLGLHVVLKIDGLEQQYDVPRDLFVILGGGREIFRVLRCISLTTAVIVANVVVVFLILFSDLLFLLHHRLLIEGRRLLCVGLELGHCFETAAVSWFFGENDWHLLLHSLILIQSVFLDVDFCG